MIGKKQRQTPALRRGVNVGFVDLERGFLGNAMMTPAAVQAAEVGNLKNFIAAITPGGIGAQEAEGQAAQAELETLPVDGTSNPADRALFEALGFKFGKPVDGGLFVNAEFPKGWKKVPTAHSMWTNLVDDKGRKRGGIFYKAAFYDEKAHVHLDCRFHVSHVSGEIGSGVSDACGKVCRMEVWDVSDENAMRAVGGDLQVWEKSDQMRHRITRWLDQNYPYWQNVEAYWD